MNAKKISLGGIAIGFVGLVLTLLLPAIGVNMFGPAKAAIPQPAACTNTVTYYANTAPAGSNDFGPNQAVPSSTTLTSAQSTQLAQAAFTRLQTKMGVCASGATKSNGDPLFTADMVAYKQTGVNVSAANTQAQAAVYAGNMTSWNGDVKNFFANVTSYDAEYDANVGYQTHGMIPNGASMPSLIKATMKVQVGWTLKLHFKDGTVLTLRIICDLQPVEQTFPNVPTTPVAACVPSAANNNCGMPKGCTSGCSPTNCTSGCSPTGCTSNCTPTTPCSSCEHTATQPVQVPGQPTVAVSNAPSVRPTPKPTGPASQPTNAPAPTSIPDGYEAPPSSHAPGGTQCGTSCSGGGNPTPSGPASTPTQVASQPPQTTDPGGF